MRLENLVLKVEGGKTLKGKITPQGAKNEALQVLCAVLLTEEKVIIHNIPDINDVNKLIEILIEFGVQVKRLNRISYEFIANNIDISFQETIKFEKMVSTLRGSIMIIGPLITRFHRAKIPQPGGDKIGRRRLDTHLLAIEKLGVNCFFDSQKRFYQFHTINLKGTYILLDEPSLTATANVIMSSVMAKGETTIYNAACEPYIQQLCGMLNRMGARISGAGSNLLTIKGVKYLGGTTHTLLPDMIEVGSFIGLAAMTSSEITIKNVQISELGLIPQVFKRLGIQFFQQENNLFVPAQDHYQIERYIDGSILTISDGPWPLFTPDLLSIVLVVATQGRGTLLVHQKMFESRLFFVDKLIDMGAQIILCDPHRANVIGLDKKISLRAISMGSPDIRAGVALLIAALSAEGTSYIYNAEQIDRGYQQIDKRLNLLGANICRL